MAILINMDDPDAQDRVLDIIQKRTRRRMEMVKDEQGVFIKGAKMPETCEDCRMNYDGFCSAGNLWSIESLGTLGAISVPAVGTPFWVPRPKWCPLKEVKTDDND